MNVFLKYDPRFDDPWEVIWCFDTYRRTQTFGLEWSLPAEVQGVIEKAKGKPGEMIFAGHEYSPLHDYVPAGG